jgi:hypothetical protein
MTPITNRHAIAKSVLARLEDGLGGEGWDNPKLVKVVEKWIGWPATWEDQVIDIEAEVESLLEQSFDPRDLVDWI